MANCRGGGSAGKGFMEESTVDSDCISSQVDHGGGCLASSHNDDYKGGLLSDYAEKCGQKKRETTSIPFDSSGGFGNTIKVLIQSVTSGSRRLDHSPPSFLHSISEESDVQEDLTPIPTELELELEATTRIRELATNEPENHTLRDFLSNFCSHRDHVENPVIPDNCDQQLSDQCDSECEDILKTEGESSDYLYHIAKEPTGNLYLRVIKHLRDNRGNFICTEIFSSIIFSRYQFVSMLNLKCWDSQVVQLFTVCLLRVG